MTSRTPARTIDFGGLDIAFDEHVLTPRPWTLRQSEWAERLLREAPEGPVLELCAGVGHIGLRAVADTERRLVMVDVDAGACAHAVRNAEAAGMAARVEVRRALVEQAVAKDERFALVIADPPWVSTAAVHTFPGDPPLAIDGGPEGLDVARRCVAVASVSLVTSGSMLLQLGSVAQADALTADGPLEVVSALEEPGRGVVVHLAAARRQEHGWGAVR